MGRQIIHVSPDSCGGAGLSALFRLNGLSVPPHDAAMARDLLYYKAAGLPPPRAWHDYALLTELHHHNGYGQPPALGYAELNWLDANFSGALFLLTTRDVEGWIAERLGATSLRRDARATAYHQGCAPADLPDQWVAEWNDHLARVRTHFAGRADFLELDLEGMDFATLCDRLSPHVSLSKRPREKEVLAIGGALKLARMQDLLNDFSPAVGQNSDQVDQDLLDVLVPHCVGQMTQGVARPNTMTASQLYGWWDGGDQVLDRQGTPLEIAFDHTTKQFRAKWGGFKTMRLEESLNQLYALGRRDAIQVDMQDARRAGSTARHTLCQPVLTYNRREGAVNVALWPLPGFHDIGDPEFLSQGSHDDVPFMEKRDVAIWRGRLAGAATRADGTLVAVDNVLRRLSKPSCLSAERAVAVAELFTVPRLRVVRRFAGRLGLDFRLRISRGLRACADLPELRRYLGPPLSHRDMLSCRYQICLSGHDVGTSFIWQANSQAVVLKEEAGWEVYYSALFHPWEHYIPLAPLAEDLDEKLAWARANPARCVEISNAARTTVQRLAHRPTQLALMRAVAQAIPSIDNPFKVAP